MSTRVKIAVLVALSFAQLAAASWSIARYESVLAFGSLYRIRTAPVDPADAFRGRYVAVRPSITLTRPIAADTERLLHAIQARNGTGYVLLGTDAEGFARAAGISADAPRDGDYLEVAHVQPQWNRETRQGRRPEIDGYTIGLRFDRYYMNEGTAPIAQQRYADATRRNAGTRAWLAVRVKNGLGVVSGLFIDGVPIEEIVAASRQ
jgi:uncharacterized membrane-anchored protein